jgi:ribosome biogenesis GTPase
VGGGVYAVARDDGSVVEASLRGRLKREARAGGVVIGDRVEVVPSGDAWVIESVDERTTTLVRRGRGGRAPKVLVANLDRIFVVVALRDPPPSTQLVDRLLALVESSGMHPVLVLNKVDLDGAEVEAERLTGLYEGIGYEVVRASAERGDGIDALRTRLCRGSSALIGPSGVGKSSLLNAVAPELDLRTGALSRKTGTGRHTTVGSRMLALECGGLVADTPGFGDVGLWAIEPTDVAACFPEFVEPAGRCRFRGCAHRKEPGCAVRDAVEDGGIPRSRYESYCTLRDEAEAAAAR